MRLPSERAKDAFEKAIINIRKNHSKLIKYADNNIQISSKKEFSEFAEKLNDTQLAESYCIAKYGKNYKKVLK